MAAQAAGISSIHTATGTDLGHIHPLHSEASYTYSEYSSQSCIEELLSGHPTEAHARSVPTTWQEKVFATFDDPEHSPLAFWVNVFILVLILVSTAVFCVSSLPRYFENTPPALFWLEVICVGVFTIEYLTKLLTCADKWDFVKSPMNLVDLAAILPFYIELALSGSNIGSLAVVRVVRLVRVFRLFKLSKYSKGFSLVTKALLSSLDALALLLFLFLLAIVFFSSGIYYAELSESHYDYESRRWIRSDGNVSPFQSIPGCFWWSTVTMTTVGYGDQIPISTGGRILASCCMVCGIVIIAFPITILGATFSRVWSEENDSSLKLLQQGIAPGKTADTLAYLDSEQKQIIKSLHEVHAVLEVLHTKQHNINLVVRALQSRLNSDGELT